MILERQKVLRASGTVHVSHARHRSTRKMQCHRYAVLFRHVADLMRLEDATGGCKVRLNLAHRMSFAEDPERLLQINIFSSENRSRTLIGDLFEQIGVHPRN